ncbi:MAG: hypothetical protein Q8R83_03255 [Legionellaceae bacterium]|nr:hypothetical protein [Legionellaceae bacterium]
MNNEHELKLRELEQNMEDADNALDGLLVPSFDESNFFNYSAKFKYDYCCALSKLIIAQFSYFKLSEYTNNRKNGLLALTYSIAFGYHKALAYISDTLQTVSSQDLILAEFPESPDLNRDPAVIYLSALDILLYDKNNKITGLSLLKQAAFAAEPDANALFLLGFLYYRQKDYQTADKLLKSSFAKNCGIAGYYCARINTILNRANLAKAYYNAAACMGVSYALRDMYHYVEKNKDYLFLAAIQDEPESQYMLAQLNRSNSPTDSSIWMKQAADNGHPIAQSIMHAKQVLSGIINQEPQVPETTSQENSLSY